MTVILVALGAFMFGSGSSLLIGRYWFLEGLQLGRDDRALDPGETTGRLSVGESSGRHAAVDWPSDTEQTQTIPPVPVGGWADGGFLPGVRPEARA